MTIKLGTIDLAGLASSNSDNISITHNSSDELQTIGVINQKDTTQSLKTWVGTKAEYDALETKNNDTIYNVTDDGNVNQSLLEMIYPVGSIYIGTMNICPLSALFGTWEKVSSGRVLQGADENHNPGTTIEAGLPNHTHGETFQFESFPNGRPLNKEYNVESEGSIPAKSLRTSLTCRSAGVDNESDILQTRLASKSIYGASETVQPAAFVVNIWRRTA